MELLFDEHSQTQTVCPDQQPVQYPHFARRILCELCWGLIKCPVSLHVILGLPHGIWYLGIPQLTQIASISSFSWLQSHMYVCEVEWQMKWAMAANGKTGITINRECAFGSMHAGHHNSVVKTSPAFSENFINYITQNQLGSMCVYICDVCVGKFIITLSMQPFQCVFWLSCGVGGWTDRHLLQAVSV